MFTTNYNPETAERSITYNGETIVTNGIFADKNRLEKAIAMCIAAGEDKFARTYTRMLERNF